jgi:hypothetical protein
MRRQRITTMAAAVAVVAVVAALGLVATTGGAGAAPRDPGAKVAVATTTVPPRGPGDLVGPGTGPVPIVTWCHGALQCLVVKDLCAGIFVYDEVDGNGDPTHGYCDDSAEGQQAQLLVATPVAKGPGPVFGTKCPAGTFLSPFQQPIYDEDGLFVVGFETVWYCLPDDLRPAG